MSAEALHVVYDEALVRKAVRMFVWRRLVVEQKLLWAVACAMFILCALLLFEGDRSWAVVVAGAGPLLAVLFVAAGWIAHLRASFGRLRAIPNRSAEFTLDEDGFCASSTVGEIRRPWTSVEEVWAHPRFWMFLLARNLFVTLPTDNVPAATLEHLRDWLGSKVIEV